MSANPTKPVPLNSLKGVEFIRALIGEPRCICEWTEELTPAPGAKCPQCDLPR